MLQDLRYAIRTLRRQPGFTVAATTILALGVGLSVTVFTIFSATYSTERGLNAIEPLMYSPLGGRNVPQLLVRSAPGGRAAIAAATTTLDPRVQMRVEPLSAQRDRQLTMSRTTAWLAGVLGLLALAVATVGIFGVCSYVVGQRTREIGIRSALGAQRAEIMRLLLAATSGPVWLGLALGLVASMAAARAIRQFLFGVSVLDPAAYVSVCAILASAAIAATFVPMRHAIRIDLVSALRCE